MTKVQFDSGDELLSPTPCVGASRSACEGPAAWAVESRSSRTSGILTTEQPWCFKHGMEEVDRAVAAGSIANVELKEIARA